MDGGTHLWGWIAGWILIFANVELAGSALAIVAGLALICWSTNRTSRGN